MEAGLPWRSPRALRPQAGESEAFAGGGDVSWPLVRGAMGSSGGDAWPRGSGVPSFAQMLKRNLPGPPSSRLPSPALGLGLGTGPGLLWAPLEPEANLASRVTPLTGGGCGRALGLGPTGSERVQASHRTESRCSSVEPRARVAYHGSGPASELGSDALLGAGRASRPASLGSVGSLLQKLLLKEEGQGLLLCAHSPCSLALPLGASSHLLEGTSQGDLEPILPVPAESSLKWSLCCSPG